eukprot:gb/GEZN01007398.1/.p1 GENE.gb/GEZN01007398.1/~~gb/GEZN01007398.1/.p1  ORF type:complete len:447 (-),score=78.09 gb/GEZN01007398.1/:172-1512(-)
MFSAVNNRLRPAMLTHLNTHNSRLNFCAHRALTSIATQPVDVSLARLSDLSVLRMEGPDAAKFMQGFVTNDMRLFDEAKPQQGSVTAVYAHWLTAKGRVLFDTIITQDSTQKELFFLQCKSADSAPLLKHIKTFRLRSKFDVKDASSERSVYAAWPSSTLPPPSPPPSSHSSSSSSPVCPNWGQLANTLASGHFFQDPRNTALGARFLVPAGPTVLSSALPSWCNIEALAVYNNYCMLLGIAQGNGCGLERDKSFPLEANLEYLNGCSFSKGCYLGQELTARTHFRGLIRKRIFPVLLSSASLSSSSSSPPSPSPSSSSSPSSSPLRLSSFRQESSDAGCIPSAISSRPPVSTELLPPLGSDIFVTSAIGAKAKKAGRVVAIATEGPLQGRLGLALLYIADAVGGHRLYIPRPSTGGHDAVNLTPYLPDWLPDFSSTPSPSEAERE